MMQYPADKTLFTRTDITHIKPGQFAASSDGVTPLVSVGFSSCTGLLILSQNKDGTKVADLFHLHPGTLEQTVVKKLQEINLRPGNKLGVFMTTTQSAGIDANDVEAEFHQKAVERLVKGAQLSPTIQCPKRGMSVAYTPEDAQVHIFDYKDISHHVPFDAAALQSIGQPGGHAK